MAWQTIVVRTVKTGTLAVTPSAISISLRRTKLKKMSTGNISTVRKGGGKTTVDNVIPACSRCNSSKQAYDVVEWYTKQLFYSKDRLDSIIKFVTARR